MSRVSSDTVGSGSATPMRGKSTTNRETRASERSDVLCSATPMRGKSLTNRETRASERSDVLWLGHSDARQVSD